MHSIESPAWLAWNLSLAAIPVVLGQFLAWWGITLRGKIKRPLWSIPLVIIGILWLAFLPNSCYLLTEWRHFFFDPAFVNMRHAAITNEERLVVAQYGFFFIIYSLVGVLFYGLSIRPVVKLLRSMKLPTPLLAVPFFVLVSLGVYLGLIVRFNSWQVITDFSVVWATAVHAAEAQELRTVILVFALLLWVLYIIVDIWIDGASARILARPGLQSEAGRTRKK